EASPTGRRFLFMGDSVRRVGEGALKGRSGFLKRLRLRALETRQLAAGGLRIGCAHERLADEDGIDADALEVVELLARVEAGLGHDGLARGDVRQELVG